MPERLAIELLRAGEDAGEPARPSDELLRRAHDAGLDDGESARAALLAATAWRRLGTLRALVRAFAPRAPKPDVAACLHVALSELFFVPDGDDERSIGAALAAAAELFDQARARFVDVVLHRALERRRPGHARDAQRDLVDAPWHVEGEPVLRDPAQHRHLWAEDAVSMPAALVKRWTERYGWDGALLVARAALHAPRGDGRAAALAEACADGAPVVEVHGTRTADFAAFPAARWRFGPRALAALAAAGSAELAAAADAAPPGTRLVLATRSLEPAENAGAVRQLLAARAGAWSLARASEHRPEPGRERGGYVAVLTRAP